ncbi:BPI fold-containing family A member 2 isoform X2 [Elephas maximus indicus]|uniref:BPI fold-containing family A member 2 isoform X2 n=1 Tax=Elephas maximus indicus TaxID=99487 RepID=UPI00211688D2|nr:BPI fold-containing family A member 2 isoform X2 [Elephas maximus indicus]
MFQLWKLALLCGLLTGTSASLLGNFGNDPNVLDNLKPILDKGLETVDNTLETVDNTLKTADNSVQDDLQKLKLKIEGLQDSKAWQAIQEKYQETGKLLDKGLSGLISDIKSLGLKIGKSRILDLKAELTPDGQGLNLRFPTTANVNLALPLIGNIVNLNAALDILTGVSIDIDTQTGLPVVILGECTSDPDSVQVNLLNRRWHSVVKKNSSSGVKRRFEFQLSH